MFRQAVVFLITLIPFLVYSQNKSTAPSGKFTLNGYVRDSLSGELIIGATISINGQGKGVASNQYGFYSITLEPGDYLISVTHVSYQQKILQLGLVADTSFNFDLIPKSAAISEVIVYGSRRRDANVKNAEMGMIDLSTTRIKNIPAVLGVV